MDLPLVIFDGDCGFCTRMAGLGSELLDHHTGIDPKVAPSHRVDLAALGIDPARANRELLWVGPDGTVLGGADAVAAWLCWQSGPWRPFGVLLRSRGVRPVAAAAYRVIARNRHRLPGATDACRI